ncbi:MAG: hypothetical protein KDI44_19085 [Thiothrix sp.]|nr:hypothetical protein [Thiothrix sp.]HPQ97743.1 hypothetical protein [Thiolinea sp.]
MSSAIFDGEGNQTTPLHSFSQLFERATIGPLSGEFVVLCGLVFHGSWILFACLTWRQDVSTRRRRQSNIAMG